MSRITSTSLFPQSTRKDDAITRGIPALYAVWPALALKHRLLEWNSTVWASEERGRTTRRVVNQADLDEKETRQQRLFEAFLQTQSYEIRSGWQSRGVDPPVDFISRERGIGVELTEWRDRERSQWVEERDRFRNELLTAIEKRGLAAFRLGGAGYTAEIRLEDGPPRRRSKEAIINALLTFLQDSVRRARSRFLPYGAVNVVVDELPITLRPCINSITIYIFPGSNPGVVVTDSFDPFLAQPAPGVALSSFRERLREKTIAGAEKYAREKVSLQLRELWLVVHYSSPGVFREPLTELRMDIGYGEHRRQTQRAVGLKLREIAQEIGAGPFDRIYFLVDCQPDPFSELIFRN